MYKAELRKQIVEDKKRKEERRAKEKAEDDRIEKKIREFHEEERKRLRAEEETRAGIERFHHKHHKIEVCIFNTKIFFKKLLPAKAGESLYCIHLGEKVVLFTFLLDKALI